MTNARDLSNRLAELLRKERHAMADFLLALADFDRLAAWRELGHASLFSFLRRELRLSAGAAQYRKTAAELVQRFPEVEAALRAGDLCLSSIVELAKVLTPENVAEVLPRFFGLSSRDAAEVAVSIRPIENPPSREVVTWIAPAAPVMPSAPSLPPHSGTEALRAPETDPVPEMPLMAAAARTAPRGSPAAPRSTVEPLGPDLARVHFTVSGRFLAKLRAAKDALSHAKPGASSEEVLEAALDVLLAQRAKRKGIVEKLRKTAAPAASPSTAVPAAVRREAWKRSGGKCEWIFDSGERCGSTVRLELDHVTPRALGGPSTIDNARVLCKPHNLLAARRIFGDTCIERYSRRGASGGTAAPPEKRVEPERGRGSRRRSGGAQRDLMLGF
jgi:hypothetical protein